MSKWNPDNRHPASPITVGTFRDLDATIERIYDQLEICPNDLIMQAVSRGEGGDVYLLRRHLGARGLRVLRVAQINANGLSKEIMMRNDAEKVGEVSLLYALGVQTTLDLQNLHRKSPRDVILSNANTEFIRQDIVRRDQSIPFTAEQIVYSAFGQRAGVYSPALN